jgi:hypothetical protein
MMEHLTQILKDYGPYVLTGAIGIMTKVLHRVNKSVSRFEETVVKADLVYEESSARVPEIKQRFETWKEHRKII